MNKHPTLTTRARHLHSSSIPDKANASGWTQHDEISKSINDIPYRQRRRSAIPYYHQLEKKSSLLPMYLNNILLVLIRLMILFLVVLIVSLTFYYTIVYIYTKPNKNEWERMIDWFFKE